jgi:HAD superfamily hydrolase (TIGR01509 family)
MKNIKAIIFDLGAVILNINYQNTIDEFGKIGIQNASSYYSKKAQNSLFNQIETGEISDKEFLLKLQKETPNINIKQVEDAWNAMLLDLPENRINLLKKLKTTYSIFLLSNTNSIHIAEFKKRLGNNQYNKFYNLFNKVYYSHKIGFRKPQSEAFQIILDENKLLANEVFFIDDSYQHIKGAKKLGIKTHHLQENEEITTLFPDIAL